MLDIDDLSYVTVKNFYHIDYTTIFIDSELDSDDDIRIRLSDQETYLDAGQVGNLITVLKYMQDKQFEALARERGDI